MKQIAIIILLLSPLVASGQDEYVNWMTDKYCQNVFYAVLEGLYADGVSDDVVDVIVPIDKVTKQANFRESFVYACPLCHPAFEAFRLYRSREKFYGQKGERDTFGKGLSPEIIAELKSGDNNRRLAALQMLITKWVSNRMDSLRLTEAERNEWHIALRIRMKQGVEMLHRSQGSGSTEYMGWKTCAICEGSAGACELKKETPKVEKLKANDEF